MENGQWRASLVRYNGLVVPNGNNLDPVSLKDPIAAHRDVS